MWLVSEDNLVQILNVESLHHSLTVMGGLK